MNVSLYVHIPYCLRKCSYCDFTSYESGKIPLEEYPGLLHQELRQQAEQFAPVTVPTVYFGGGTPSLLSPQMVGRLLETAADHYRLATAAEVTLEANPGTVTLESLSGYRAAGVNRLSLGVQALDDRLLTLLGRVHSADQAREALQQARQAGFTNVGIDLMHSLPGQSLTQWETTLRRAVEMAPEHISAYGLSVEAGTPFAAEVAAGKLLLPDDELAAAMFELTADRLAEAGYEQYEISNFARPGCRSCHNQVYWRRGNYLGFGAGAHSFVREPGYGRRWENPPGLAEYAAQQHGTAPGYEEQSISREDAMAEFFFLGLRLLDGVGLEEFKTEFRVEATDAFPGVIERHIATGLLLRDGNTIRLSRRGIMLANRVLADFI